MPEHLTGESILDRVIDTYLNSGDFNGHYVGNGTFDDSTLKELRNFVSRGLVQIVSEQDYPNPHIRPWPSRRTLEDQISDIDMLIAGDDHAFCAYPTTDALEERTRNLFPDEPFKQALAEGRGALELAYFTMDVLEPYRNDPRYHFRADDFGVDFGVSDETYLDKAEPERDKIASLRAGYAYDPATLDASLVKRFLCVFFTDLADLTPEHQRRWESYLAPADHLKPHPVWMGMMMGHWADGIGVFQKILQEMQAINQLTSQAFGIELFRSTARPRKWGWVLRSSSDEWGDFILLTDKLLSENLEPKCLDAAGAPKVNAKGDQVGTLGRLSLLFEHAGVSVDVVKSIMEPLRRVRKLRQAPAHVLTDAATDDEITSRQRDLLSDLAQSLHLIREMLMAHPANRDWNPPEWLTEKFYRL